MASVKSIRVAANKQQAAVHAGVHIGDIRFDPAQSAALDRRIHEAARFGILDDLRQVLLQANNSGNMTTWAVVEAEAHHDRLTQHPHAVYFALKERLAASIRQKNRFLAKRLCECRVARDILRDDETQIQVSYPKQCKFGKCPFCSRAMARRRSRLYGPIFVQALKQGGILRQITLTIRGNPAETALQAVVRLNKALERLNEWNRRHKAIKCALIGIDVTCGGPVRFHANAHLVYIGRAFTKEELADLWRRFTGDPDVCTPHIKRKVDPLKTKPDDALARHVFRTLIYAIKTELKPVEDSDRAVDLWADAILALKGKARLFRRWGLPPESTLRPPRTTEPGDRKKSKLRKIADTAQLVAAIYRNPASLEAQNAARLLASTRRRMDFEAGGFRALSEQNEALWARNRLRGKDSP